VFEDRALIFVPQSTEEMGGWRKLQNNKLHNLYSSANIIMMIKLKRMRWVEHIAHLEEMRVEYGVFTGKPNMKRTSARTRCR
jgi:hypothetical protein